MRAWFLATNSLAGQRNSVTRIRIKPAATPAPLTHQRAVFQGDIAAVETGDVAGDGQAEANSAGRRVAQFIQTGKGANMSSRLSAAMPGPLSSTVIVTA